MVTRKDLAVLIDEETLQSRILELGKQIAADYEGKDLALIGILKGCFMFLADLSRAIERDCTVDFLGLSSYGAATTSSGVVKITSDLTRPIEGRDVLVVEDIIDTGLTMRYLLENLGTRRPNSVRVCTLLHKPANARCEVPIDYVGFTIEDHFVIGYGLDYAERLRNIPYIGYKP
ncbi:MAG: hypoxanthine phosphoribosyltransferase [Myxococcales bacterium]|nr:hypoxanthine phosphoribosyltransferase [Myxococcales bacterium]MCB9731250.1 hypoxanthine phosphoribosyltransferase [Deltaproteobacteria bacterium]